MRCDTCGNDYDKGFEVRMDDDTWGFDSFECAITRLAPTCGHCEVRVIGHGVEADGRVYCCAHCAEKAGEPELVDRV